MTYKLTCPYLEKEVFFKQGNYNYLSNVIYFILQECLVFKQHEHHSRYRPNYRVLHYGYIR